jgi:hypothetical protein
MKISQQNIEEAEGLFDSMSDEQLIEYYNTTVDYQPALYGYLMATAHDLAEELNEDILFICTVIYKAWELALPTLPVVSEEDIRSSEDFFLDEVNDELINVHTMSPADIAQATGMQQHVVVSFFIDMLFGEGSDYSIEDLSENDDLGLAVTIGFIFMKSLEDVANDREEADV